MHDHDSSLVYKGGAQEFATRFSFLHKYFTVTLKIDYTEIEVFEAGCDEASCPVEETVFHLKSESMPLKKLKVGRSLQNISKLDLHLAVQKQWSN